MSITFITNSTESFLIFGYSTGYIYPIRATYIYYINFRACSTPSQ